ncbi:hypothetical protein CY34DRAFT_725535 [Suillus luteus UH-Slu-Lm8-n1]|uniref:DUF6533 domain-containing protein n=1 Tax=Suillus luteus UH-Slu-Lm8-n1 TaxID=930992 RepID=A0A0D0B9X5_9AGAM|nr:hypothetical protein CY34DRAFT_725535 [Suillus luteus UH-Slu-Lm8-n1]
MSLQTYTYVYTSMATFWTYNYVCSLQEEWTFLLRSRWTRVKGLYIVTRILPFLLLIGHLYMNFIPNENPEKCKTLTTVFSVFGEISGGCSECFFVLRTCALWKHNRFVLVSILTCSLVIVIARVGTSFAAIDIASYETSAIPGITGCRNSADLFVPFILLFIFELGLMSLTLTRAIQGWRMANGRLYVVLVKNNLLYYLCGLFLSAVNVLASRYFPYQYHAIFQDFQFVFLQILALRMHLHLWQIDQQTQNMDSLVCISLSDM